MPGTDQCSVPPSTAPSTGQVADWFPPSRAGGAVGDSPQGVGGALCAETAVLSQSSTEVVPPGVAAHFVPLLCAPGKRLGPSREAGFAWKITAPKDKTVAPFPPQGLRVYQESKVLAQSIKPLASRSCLWGH